MDIVEEQYITQIDQSDREQHLCIKCGKKLRKFIAYIPTMGEACMDCYIEAAKDDESGKPAFPKR
jgi:NMD protein affecting ribosome stability and mRNA decay